MSLHAVRSLSMLVAGMMVLMAAPPASAIRTVPVGTFTRPVYVAAAPGAPDLLFVVEQQGKIQVLRNETRLAAPFLDISDLVLGPPDPGAGGEQGLLSVAFPPNYEQSGLFYVFFVNSKGNLEIDEFRRSVNRLRADRTTRRPLLAIGHQGATSHNGGQLQFDPNGLLYISTGDGGSLSPRGYPARDLNYLLGKILRIDPLARTGSLPYRIPTSNPFVGKPGRDEIYAYGLRNPWRFSIDAGRIIIGDVGAGLQEEVNFLTIVNARGVNFGWPEYEGTAAAGGRPGPHPPVFPMFTYGHAGGRCAIIGGYLVRDSNLPALVGRYLYGDSCSGEIRSFIPNVPAQTASDDKSVGLSRPGMTSFGVGFGGKIYIAQAAGVVSRLEPDPP